MRRCRSWRSRPRSIASAAVGSKSVRFADLNGSRWGVPAYSSGFRPGSRASSSDIGVNWKLLMCYLLLPSSMDMAL